MNTTETERCCYFKPGHFLLMRLKYMVNLSLEDDFDLASLEELEINFKGSHLTSVHRTLPVK